MRRPERGGIFFRLIFLCFIIVFLVLVYLVRNPLLRLAASLWIVDEPVAHADAMIVLSDDNYEGDRAVHAAELYRQGVAPVIVASDRMMRPTVGIGELIGHDLEDHGVPASAIVISPPHRATNTREEAYALRDLVISRGWKRILIVTSNYHTRRARFIFGRVFPMDVSINMAAAPDSEFDSTRWWLTRSGLKMFFNETVGYLVARWELRSTRGVPSGAALLLFAKPRPRRDNPVATEF